MLPQPEFNSVSRRPLDVEDYVDVLRRNIGLMFGPAFLGLVVAFMYAFTQPDVYVSEAVIRIIPPQIAQTLVPSAIVLGLSQRVNAMAQTVMSRGNLMNLITTNNLYPRQRSKEPLEDLVERMRKQVSIGGVEKIGQNGGDVAAFRLSFRYENRQMAQKICTDLVRKFMDENIQERKKAASGAKSFFTEEQSAAKQKLDEAEAKLTTFRMAHQGSLPEEMNVNSAQLNSLNQQVDLIQQTINRTNQEKLILESNLQSLKEQRNALTPPTEEATTTSQKSDRLQQLDREIENYELRLAGLKEKLKETHPDIQTVQGELAVLRKTRDMVAKTEPTKTTATTVQSSYNRQLMANYERERKSSDAEIKRVETLIRTREMDAEQQRAEASRISAEIHKTEGRLGSMPVGLEEYTKLNRERDLARTNYAELSAKMQTTNLFEKMENMQQGEVLEVLDTASLPQTAAEPNRWYAIAVGLGVGFVIGFGLTVVREIKDTSMQTLKDVRAYTQLNVLGSVPLLENELTVRRRRRFRFLAWSTAVMLGCFAMSGSLYYYYLLRT